jgi:hypothetical protein
LRQSLDHPALEVLHCEYINVAAFPAIWVIRKVRSLLPARGTANGTRSEDAIPPPWLNTLLRKVFVGLACQTVLSFPCGVGLLAVARRKAN